jgi:hypothetical protein
MATAVPTVIDLNGVAQRLAVIKHDDVAKPQAVIKHDDVAKGIQ